MLLIFIAKKDIYNKTLPSMYSLLLISVYLKLKLI